MVTEVGWDSGGLVLTLHPPVPLSPCSWTSDPRVAAMPPDGQEAPSLLWALGYPPFFPTCHNLVFLVSYLKGSCPSFLELDLVCLPPMDPS